MLARFPIAPPDSPTPTRAGPVARGLLGLVTLSLAVTGLAACTHTGTRLQTSTTAAPGPGNSAPGGPGTGAVPGMPPVVDPSNIYSETGAGKLSAAARAALPRIYVPNHGSNNVSVIDPASRKVLAVLPVGANPQHVIPSYDLTTLWVANNADGTNSGSLTPIDPKTGKAGPSVVVDDPYNLYFTPDGAHAIVVAEARKRLDFRDPKTMHLQYSIDVPSCPGINHMDFSADGTYLIATCEDASRLVKVDWAHRSVVASLELGPNALPQDIRLGPDGQRFFVADMAGNRLILIDGGRFLITGSIDLAASGGIGAHGLYPSRDGKQLYVANRGSAGRSGVPPHGPGSVSVVDFATHQVVANWPVPGGGSPDMGGVNADGTELWLSGRYDDQVYVFDTRAGRLAAQIPIGPKGHEPHGLCVWPQPGRYSLGHTGNLR